MLRETQDNNFTVAHTKWQLKVMVINKNALTQTQELCSDCYKVM